MKYVSATIVYATRVEVQVDDDQDESAIAEALYESGNKAMANANWDNSYITQSTMPSLNDMVSFEASV